MLQLISALVLAASATGSPTGCRYWTFTKSITSVGLGDASVGVVVNNHLWILSIPEWDEKTAKFKQGGPELPSHYRLIPDGGLRLTFAQGALYERGELKPLGTPPAFVVSSVTPLGDALGMTDVDPGSGERLPVRSPALASKGQVRLLATDPVFQGSGLQASVPLGRALATFSAAEDKDQVYVGSALRLVGDRWQVNPVCWEGGRMKNLPLPPGMRDGVMIAKGGYGTAFGVTSRDGSLMPFWRSLDALDPGPEARPACFTLESGTALSMPEPDEEMKKRSEVYAGLALGGAGSDFAVGRLFTYRVSTQAVAATMVISSEVAWLNGKMIKLEPLLPIGFQEARIVACEESFQAGVGRVWITGRLDDKWCIAVLPLAR